MQHYSTFRLKSKAMKAIFYYIFREKLSFLQVLAAKKVKFRKNV